MHFTNTIILALFTTYATVVAAPAPALPSGAAIFLRQQAWNYMKKRINNEFTYSEIKVLDQPKDAFLKIEKVPNHYPMFCEGSVTKSLSGDPTLTYQLYCSKSSAASTVWYCRKKTDK